MGDKEYRSDRCFQHHQPWLYRHREHLSESGKQQQMKDQASVFSHAALIIDEVQSAVIGSKTYVYLKAEGSVYTIEATTDNAAEVLFIHAGDRLSLYYDEEDGRRIVQQIEF